MGITIGLGGLALAGMCALAIGISATISSNKSTTPSLNQY